MARTAACSTTTQEKTPSMQTRVREQVGAWFDMGESAILAESQRNYMPMTTIYS